MVDDIERTLENLSLTLNNIQKNYYSLELAIVETQLRIRDLIWLLEEEKMEKGEGIVEEAD